MSTRGKSITLFLMDGSVTGCIRYTLANWTGVAYKIPRTKLDNCLGRSDLKRSGVYFLFGTSDDTGKNVVYIGQAGARKKGEGILSRLQEHKRNPDKDYWTEAVIFTTSNDSSGATEISYLENRFCNMAIEAKRYVVKNGNDPAPGHISEEKESELEEFIDNSRIIMGTLGHRVFEPLVDDMDSNFQDEAMDNDEQLLFFKIKPRKSKLEIKASGKQTDEGIVVLKGSMISTTENENLSLEVKKARKKALIDENGILQEDTLFHSPSSAAAFVAGRPFSGNVAWKNQAGKTLNEIESN